MMDVTFRTVSPHIVSGLTVTNNTVKVVFPKDASLIIRDNHVGKGGRIIFTTE